jgi:hypothetical protein
MYSKTTNATTIRQATTANFLIDSRDRVGFGDTSFPPNATPANFTISKNNNLLNGFFTRIIPNEVCLDYCINNIDPYWGNAFINFQPQVLNTSTIGTFPSTIQANLSGGNYTVAQALDNITASFNSNATAAANSLTLSTIQSSNGRGGGRVSLGMFQSTIATNFLIPLSTVTNTPSTGTPINLVPQLNLNANYYASSFTIDCPKILPTSYLDFICPNLTQNQNLKDGSTSLDTTDIIYRWYLAWDVPEPLDTYGYPVYQGYKRFIQRRPIAFPKQIRWENNIPIGQLTFQVQDDQARTLDPAILGATSSITNKSEMEWQMTCLVSED